MQYMILFWLTHQLQLIFQIKSSMRLPDKPSLFFKLICNLKAGACFNRPTVVSILTLPGNISPVLMLLNESSHLNEHVHTVSTCLPGLMDRPFKASLIMLISILYWYKLKPTPVWKAGIENYGYGWWYYIFCYCQQYNERPKPIFVSVALSSKPTGSYGGCTSLLAQTGLNSAFKGDYLQHFSQRDVVCRSEAKLTKVAVLVFRQHQRSESHTQNNWIRSMYNFGLFLWYFLTILREKYRIPPALPSQHYSTKNMVGTVKSMWLVVNEQPGESVFFNVLSATPVHTT